MRTADFVLVDAFKAYGIGVECKDYTYEVVDSNTSYKLIHAFNDFDEIINKYLIRYEPDTFDCDDYSFLFKVVCSLNKFTCAYAEGYVDRFAHAFNVVPYWHSGRVLLILVEPQLINTGVPFWWLMNSDTVITPYGTYRVRSVVL